MLQSKRPLLVASRKTPGIKRVCMHQAQRTPAKTAMAMVNMFVAATGTDMTATSLLIPPDRMGTGTTVTEAGTAAGIAARIAAGTAVETGTGPEASLAIVAIGMGLEHQ